MAWQDIPFMISNITTFVNKYFLLPEIKSCCLYYFTVSKIKLISQCFQKSKPIVSNLHKICSSYFFDSPAEFLDHQLSCTKLKAFVENNRNSWGSKIHNCKCTLKHEELISISLGKHAPIEISRNTQHWQYWRLYYYQLHCWRLSENRCEWGVNVYLWMGYHKWILIDSWWRLDIFVLLAWIRKLAVQHFYIWGLKSIH